MLSNPKGAILKEAVWLFTVTGTLWVHLIKDAAINKEWLFKNRFNFTTNRLTLSSIKDSHLEKFQTIMGGLGIFINQTRRPPAS